MIAAIAERYPGTQVVVPDMYAKRYAREIAVAEQLGFPRSNPVSDSTLRVWTERGLQRGFQVPIRDELVLFGRLDAVGGYFSCQERAFELGDIEPLVAILNRFPLTLEYYAESRGRE